MYNCALRGSRPTLLIKVLSICLFLFVAQVVPVTWRLMPLGDSKSEGTSHDNCWRYYLSEKLNENGFTDMDFVGPHAGTYSDDDTWWDSESACFYSANSGQVLNGGLPRGRSGLGSVHDWAPAYQPNLAIIHLGTNDIRGGAGTSTIIARLKGIIDVLRASDPTIKVIVAQIPTWDFSAFGGSANAVMSLNNAVADLPSYSTTTSPVTVVDLYTDYAYQTMDKDGIHPGTVGAPIIADRIYPILTGLLGPAPDMVTINAVQTVAVVGEGVSLNAEHNTDGESVGWAVTSGASLSSRSGDTVVCTLDGSRSSVTVTAAIGDATDELVIELFDPSTFALRINCGGGAEGDWESDAAYAEGGERLDFAVPCDVSNVADPGPASIYRTVRHLDHDYHFRVPDGNYTIRIHFADAFAEGQAMDYSIEGEGVLSAFDPCAAAGGVNTAIVKEFCVAVDDGDGMLIEARQGSGNDVFEAGVEVLPTPDRGTAARNAFPYRHSFQTHAFRVESLSDGDILVRAAAGISHADIIHLNGTSVPLRLGADGRAAISPAALCPGVYLIRTTAHNGSQVVRITLPE